MNKTNVVFFNGKFVSEDEAKIPISTHALHYGTGCFEGIRAYYNKKELLVFRMEDHYKRLLQSCKIIMTQPSFTVKELCDITIELIKKNFAPEDLYIRPLAYKADPAIGNFNLKILKNGLAIYTVVLGRYLNTDKGIRANVSSWRRIPDNVIPPRAKITGGYVNSALAKTESLLAGFEESLLLDNLGHVMEGTGENIFMVKNGVVITPGESDDILIGITRQTIMMLCKNDLGIKIQERSIDRSELYQADEIFVAGTAAEVTPVIEIDNRIVGAGKRGVIATKIKEAYFRIVHGENPKYESLITRIPSPKN